MTEEPETTTTPKEAAAVPKQASAKKPRIEGHTRNAAPSKREPPKKTARATKAHKAARSAKSAKTGSTHARRGSKTANVVELLKRPGGATGADLMKATGWQAHSVRGFISGVLGRRMGLKVSSKVEDGQRRYALRG